MTGELNLTRFYNVICSFEPQNWPPSPTDTILSVCLELLLHFKLPQTGPLIPYSLETSHIGSHHTHTVLRTQQVDQKPHIMSFWAFVFGCSRSSCRCFFFFFVTTFALYYSIMSCCVSPFGIRVIPHQLKQYNLNHWRDRDKERKETLEKMCSILMRGTCLRTFFFLSFVIWV